MELWLHASVLRPCQSLFGGTVVTFVVAV